MRKLKLREVKLLIQGQAASLSIPTQSQVAKAQHSSDGLIGKVEGRKLQVLVLGETTEKVGEAAEKLDLHNHIQKLGLVRKCQD